MKAFRKVIVALTAILIFTGSANAKIINLGIKAGMNVNKISLNNFVHELTAPENSVGWEAGVMAEFNVPVIGLCLDASLMYARMNNTSSFTYIVNEEGKKKTQYFANNFIQIPINIKYKFQLPVVSSFFAPYIFTGPEFGFKLDKNTLNDIQNKTCQVAWNIGLGLQFFKHLQIGASYAFGINNIAGNIVTDLETVDLKARNNYWSVTAAWLF